MKERQPRGGWARKILMTAVPLIPEEEPGVLSVVYKEINLSPDARSCPTHRRKNTPAFSSARLVDMATRRLIETILLALCTDLLIVRLECALPDYSDRTKRLHDFNQRKQSAPVVAEPEEDIDDRFYEKEYAEPGSTRRPDFSRYKLRDKHVRPWYIDPTTTTTSTTLAPQVVQPREPECRIALRFSRMGLQRVGDKFVESSEVRRLYLDHNDIQEVSSAAFRSLPHLTILDLSANKIPVDKLLWLDTAAKLKTLVVDDNAAAKGKTVASVIPEKFLAPQPALEHLQLRRNGILSIELPLKSFAPRLTHLYLSGNNITVSTFLEYLPETLTHLYLEDNAIADVTKGHLSHIVRLNIDGNKIRQVCHEDCESSSLSLEGATRLQKLSLSRNEIQSLEVGALQEANSLTHLNLSHNQMDVVSNGTFGASSALEHLSLGYNRLTTIPFLCSLRRLMTLDLAGNKLAGIGASAFCKLPMLKTLSLNKNTITSIEVGAFEGLRVLEVLDLSDNLLYRLSHNWMPANSLRVLFLSRNRIPNFEHLSLRNATQLAHLHLEGNPLQRLTMRSMQYYPRGLTLHMENVGEVTSCENNDSEDDDQDDDDDDDDDDHDDRFYRFS